MIREIVIWPDPVLKRACEPVANFDADLKRLLDDMEESMLAARGAGLAAPQIGFALRCVTILVRRSAPAKGQASTEVLRLCNPRIIASKGSQLMREGCLSLPGYFEQVRRATWVKVEAQNEEGARVEVEGDGALAHALQHELEHLDGVVFVDHLSPLKRNLAATRFKKAKGRGMRYLAERPTPKDFTEQGS